MANLTEKEVQEIFGIKTAGLPDEQRTFINAMVGAFTDAISIRNLRPAWIARDTVLSPMPSTSRTTV